MQDQLLGKKNVHISRCIICLLICTSKEEKCMQKIYIKTLHGCQAANLKVIYASISLMATQKKLFLSQPGILIRRESSTARDPQPPGFVHLRSSFTAGDPLYRRRLSTSAQWNHVQLF